MRLFDACIGYKGANAIFLISDSLFLQLLATFHGPQLTSRCSRYELFHAPNISSPMSFLIRFTMSFSIPDIIRPNQGTYGGLPESMVKIYINRSVVRSLYPATMAIAGAVRDPPTFTKSYILGTDPAYIAHSRNRQVKQYSFTINRKALKYSGLIGNNIAGPRSIYYATIYKAITRTKGCATVTGSRRGCEHSSPCI